MDAILLDVGLQSGLCDADKEELRHQWLNTLPYRDYVFAGARELLSDLGAPNVHVFTKSRDRSYAHKKIEACGLPLLRDGSHLHIVGHKSPNTFARWLGRMSDRGIRHLVYITDEAKEIIWAHDAAEKVGIGFDGVHHYHGSVWQSDIEIAEKTARGHYFPAHDFEELTGIVRRLQGSLEGQPKTGEWRKFQRGKEVL
jgi:hypothetical protein